MTDKILMYVILSVATFALGWATAHGTVATECQRLGAFYVGDKTFECTEKK